MRILLTGGTSLLGAATVRLLQRRGDDVVVLQRNPSQLGVEERLGDICDIGAVTDAVAGVEAVIHLAARVSVTGPWDEFHQTNVVGTTNVLEAARRAGASRFVHVSSPSVAHTGHSLIGASAGPAQPGATRGAYATTKAQSEEMALSSSTDAFPVVAIRPHLVWGPGDRQLIARIVDRARRHRLVVVGSGTALIDTTYIDNAADALVAALDRAPELGGEALVVSNGQPRPVRELLERFVVAAGLEAPRISVPVPLAKAVGSVVERMWEGLNRSDVPPITRVLAEQLSTAHWFDQRRTRQALEWEPAVDLETGFRRLAAWFAEHRLTSGAHAPEDG